MIIGFDGSRAFVKNRTGTENYSYQLLKHLAKIDHQNKYLVYLRPGQLYGNGSTSLTKYSLSESDKLETSRSATNYDWPPNVTFKIIPYYRLWTQIGLGLQTFLDPLDLLFVSAHALPVIHKPGLKTVLTVHDLGAEYLPQAHLLKQRLYLNFLTRFELKSATALIAVSEATKADILKKSKANSKNIFVVYEGVNLKEGGHLSSDQLANSLKQFDLEKGKYFLFVGTVQPRKNLERLIKAFHRVILNVSEGSISEGKNSFIPNGTDSSPAKRDQNDNSLKLAIAGSKGWLADDIYKLPKALGIEKQVQFLGRVDDKDLPALYQGAIALTFPSLFEGFGLPILEAFANDCPVLTSNTSSMPEVAGQAAILVDPFDIDSISKGMTFIQNPAVRKKLVADGKKQLAKFSWEKCARETLRVIEKQQGKSSTSSDNIH